MDHKIKSQIQHRIRDELVACYPGVFNFDRRTVAQIVGCSVGHIANMEAMGSPLITSVKVGRKALLCCATFDFNHHCAIGREPWGFTIFAASKGRNPNA